MLSRLLDSLIDFGEDILIKIFALACGAGLMYFIITNAEGISPFLFNFGK
ncbi:hypothetical protein [Sutcliffiella cohnii]|nr:hypothetical protein [Sutcliffiella cohnii]